MAKKKNKNKSRLTKTDVNAICELQRKVDAYELYLQSIVIHLCSKEPYRGVPIQGTPMDETMKMIWRKIEFTKNPPKEEPEMMHVKDVSLKKGASGQ